MGTILPSTQILEKAIRKKNTNSISVGQHSVSELKGAINGEKSDRSY